VQVLTVANHLGARGGLERTQLSMAGALSARGHDLHLLYVTPGDFAEEWRKFVTSMVRVRATLPRRSDPFSSTLGAARAILTAVRRRPDVILVYRYWDVPLAVVAGAIARAPAVLYLCLPPPRSVPWWMRWALSRLSAVIAVSADTARRWHGLGPKEERVSVVLTGIDMEAFAPATPAERTSTRRALGLLPEEFVVVYAGRIGREKGVDLFLRAGHLLAEELPDLRLVVAGGPSLGADPHDSERFGAELRQLAGGLPVMWLGPRSDVKDLLAAADVAVVPSLWPEPLARSVIEPLACGVPVVATGVGGTPELLTGWLSDFLVPPEPDELAKRVQLLHGWRRSDPGLGDRCRHAVCGRLSLDREADDVEALLDSLLRRRSSAA